MFNRKVVNAMVGDDNRQGSPYRLNFHHRRSEPSPAKRKLLSIPMLCAFVAERFLTSC